MFFINQRFMEGCMLYYIECIFILCSGPKRYDVIDGRWRYLHDGMALHDLLRSEFSELMEVEIDLSQLKCSHIISDEENWTN